MLMDSTRWRRMSWNRINNGNFNPRALASSITSVISTDAPVSRKGLAMTRPASLISKYFAPQRWMLYRFRALSMSHGSLESDGLLISISSTRPHYRTLRVEYNRGNENSLERVIWTVIRDA